MAQSLEEYVAQATRAYQPASDSIQSQLNGLQGNYDTATQKINSNYALQQEQLNRQRNQAAEDASMAAAARGSGFGGQAEAAARNYYERTFTPALTTLQTNQANDLAQAKQDYENQRTSLNSQLANLQAQANQQALAQYYSDLEAERNRALQQQQIAAQNAYNQYLMDAMNKKSTGYNLSSSRNIYGGFDWTDSDGNKVRAAQVALAAAGSGSGDSFNENLYQVLSAAADQGDYYSKVIADQMAQGARFAKNGMNSTGNDMYDTLGIYRVN